MSTHFSARRLRVFVLLAAVASATPALAQEAPDPELEQEGEKRAKGSVPATNLAIQGISDGLHVRVLSREDGPAMDGEGIASCTQDCELKLPAGPYRLVTSQGELQTTKDVELDAPLRLTVSEPSTTLHGLGVGLGIAGIVVASLGSLVAVSAVATRGEGEELSGARNNILLSGLAGAAGGAGLIVGGFSLAAENRAPSLEVDRSPRLERLQRPAATGISLGATF